MKQGVHRVLCVHNHSGLFQRGCLGRPPVNLRLQYLSAHSLKGGYPYKKALSEYGPHHGLDSKAKVGKYLLMGGMLILNIILPDLRAITQTNISVLLLRKKIHL